MLGFSLRSLWNRRFVATLTVLAIGLSVALILGVERLRHGARDSFESSASGIDLIVAPRGHPVQILMATVFGVGGTGAGMDRESFEWLQDRPDVAWAVPIQMGDNHRGYPVIGTTPAYFDRVRHSGGLPLTLASGAVFAETDLDRAVVGAMVAARLGHGPGAVIVNAHGAGAVAFDVHDEAPFTVSGVLAPTGSAVDRMVFVTLEGFDAIHAREAAGDADPLGTAVTGGADHGTGMPAHRVRDATTDHDGHDPHAHDSTVGHAGYGHEPGRINAVYLGLTDRTAVLGLQRAINEHTREPLSAVLPAAALAELWSLTDMAERVMRAMAWAVALAGMIGMVVMLSASLETRRREFAILRSVGATPPRIFGLIVTEAAVLTAAGLVLGLLLLVFAAFLTTPVLVERFGVRLGLGLAAGRDLPLLALIFCAGLVAALVPAIRVYRMTLADGLSIRL